MCRSKPESSTASSAAKQAAARRCGADEVLGYDGFAQAVREATGLALRVESSAELSGAVRSAATSRR